jgi:hypothetical protein
LCFLPLLLTLRRGELNRMGFQFLHVESYARQAGKGKAGGHTVASVMAEATRQPDACPHVENPAPPVLLFGCPLAEVEAEATNWAANSVDAIGRKLRKDGLCLLGGVISAPDDMDAKDWAAMKLDAIAWLNRDGRLVSVAEHTDEAHRHIHFYKVPAPGQRFETLHPGRAAALAAKADGALKGDQNRAYKEAMRGLQDDFFEQVGARHGLTRLGPAKRRLTRSEWKAEQVAALSTSKSMDRAEKLIASAALASAAAAAAQAAADEAKAEAMANKAAVIELATKAKADADKAVAAKAEAATSKAEAAASKLEAIELATKAKADADKAEKVREANAKTVASWKRQKAAMDIVAQRISDERAEIERWSQRGGRVGAFVGRALDAVKGVLTDRKTKDAERAAALLAAQKATKEAKAMAEAERDTAKSATLAKDAAEVRARKELRAVEAERDAAQRTVARLTQPAPSHRQGPTMRH